VESKIIHTACANALIFRTIKCYTERSSSTSFFLIDIYKLVRFFLSHVAVHCEEPPAPLRYADQGGYHDWSSDSGALPEYLTRVEYRCKPGRRLVDTTTGAFRDSQVIQCQWNKQWSDYNVSLDTFDRPISFVFLH
jgi:hypothetical protein